MNIDMATYLVRGVDGAVDLVATAAKFENDLIKYAADTETEVAVIAAAVNDVFDEHRSSLNMPILTNFALMKLNAQPANYKSLAERIMHYIRSNADQPAIKAKDSEVVITPAEAPRTRLFKIAKGKNGGVSRWSDIPEKADDATVA